MFLEILLKRAALSTRIVNCSELSLAFRTLLKLVLRLCAPVTYVSLSE